MELNGNNGVRLRLVREKADRQQRRQTCWSVREAARTNSHPGMHASASPWSPLSARRQASTARIVTS